ncbi:hypothetical protein LTR53_020074, partial [Teratosphaeriaceae sp. CCFEE 6253]
PTTAATTPVPSEPAPRASQPDDDAEDVLAEGARSQPDPPSTTGLTGSAAQLDGASDEGVVAAGPQSDEDSLLSHDPEDDDAEPDWLDSD